MEDDETHSGVPSRLDSAASVVRPVEDPKDGGDGAEVLLCCLHCCSPEPAPKGDAKVVKEVACMNMHK